MHQRSGVCDGGEHAELRGTERRACRERDIARPDILAAVADVLAGVPAVAHGDAAALERLGVLLADHGVGPGGERRDVPEDGARRFGRGQHLTAPESWRDPTPGSPASRATPCPRNETRGTPRGTSGGP